LAFVSAHFSAHGLDFLGAQIWGFNWVRYDDKIVGTMSASMAH